MATAQWITRCPFPCRNGAEKLLGVLITVGQAVAYVVAGMYGEINELGYGNAILIILQVCCRSRVLAIALAGDCAGHAASCSTLLHRNHD